MSKHGITGSIIDEVHSLDIRGDQVEGESCVTRTIIRETHSVYISGDHTEDESGFT